MMNHRDFHDADSFVSLRPQKTPLTRQAGAAFRPAYDGLGAVVSDDPAGVDLGLQDVRVPSGPGRSLAQRRVYR